MGITDAIKDSVMESFNTTLSTTDIILGLLVSLIAGLFILLVYRSAMRQISANRSFCITLMLVCSISAMVVLTITSNVVLSLGMVGALSIVRFRTAIKEPMDIAFLFWSIAAGIVLAAGMIPLAVIGSVIIGVVMLVFINRKAVHDPYIAVISCANFHVGEVYHVYVDGEVTLAQWDDHSIQGTVTSYGSETDEVTVQLYRKGALLPEQEVIVCGKKAAYCFERVVPGEYIIRVHKKNHVSREYAVTVEQ